MAEQILQENEDLKKALAALELHLQGTLGKFLNFLTFLNSGERSN